MIEAKTQFYIKTLNAISQKGLDRLPPNFIIDNETENPDGILVRSADLHDMPLNDNLQFIGRAGAGVNNIPIEKCSEAGIVVCNAPGGNANAVKEMVLFGLLASSRKLIEGVEWVEEHKNSDDIENSVEDVKKSFVGPELRGKTLGVLGLGNVGILVANACVDLGMNVYGYDPYISINNAWKLNTKVKRSNDLEYLFKICDYITIHMPLTDDTRNIIDRNLLSRSENNLRLLNFARGGLVEIGALKEALENGTVARYITDFPDSETVNLPHTWNIPHLGASTPESEENSATMAVHEMVQYLQHGNIINSVNFPDTDMGICNSVHRITVNHRNIPNMIGQITAVLAEEHINISDLVNSHYNNWAYTMVDIDSEVDLELRDKLLAIDGVVRVRLIK